MKSPMPARIAAAVLALVLLASPAAAQVLRGAVLDTTSGKPLDRVRVIAFSAAGARMGDALTNTDGAPARFPGYHHGRRPARPCSPAARVRCSSALNCSVTMPAANTMFFGKPCSPSIVVDGVWRTSACGAIIAWSRR